MKKSIFTLLTLCLLLVVYAPSSFAQYAIGSANTDFVDASRSNRNIQAYTYYPATSAGANAPIAMGPFPVVVFGHGFSTTYDGYSQIWDFLVPEGYIVVMVNTETGLTANHNEFALDLAFAVTETQVANADAASFLFGNVVNKSAIGGHSMGGGCTYVAADNNSTISTIFTFSAAETTVSAIGAASNVLVPVLAFGADGDCVAPPSGNHLDMYNNVTTCKYYLELSNATHCNFTTGGGLFPGDPTFNCYFGEGLVGCGGFSIGVAAQHAQYEAALLPWLEHWLKDDPTALTTFDNIVTAGTGSDYTSALTQSACVLCSITADAGLDQTACPNEPITLTAIGGSNYTWSDGATSASTTVMTTTDATYMVTVSDGSGCTATDEVMVTINSALAADAGMDQLFCPGDVVNLTATGGTGYTWSDGATNATNMVTPMGTSSYTVTVTDGNGCSGTDEVILTEGTTASVSVIGSTINAYNGTSCNPSANTAVNLNLLILSGAGGTWTDTDGSGANISDPTTTDFTGVTAGTYTFTYSAAGTADCPGIGTASINVIECACPNLTLLPPSNALCGGDVLNLTNLEDPNIVAGTWSVSSQPTGGTAAVSNSNFDSTGQPSGNYTLTYTPTTPPSSGCPADVSEMVVISPAPTVDAGADQTICGGDMASLLATSSVTDFAWSEGATTAATMVTPSTTTTYIVTVTDASGCTAEDEVTITIADPPANAGMDQTICDGDMANLTATGGDTYTWSDGATTANTSVMPSTTTTYMVTVADATGCTAEDEIMVTVAAAPTADAGMDQTICDGDMANLTATGGDTYTWSDGATTANTSVMPSTTTTYMVTVADATGCTAEDEIEVTVQTCVTATVVQANVWLEGAWNISDMNTDLHMSGALPLTQPYNRPPWSYPGIEAVTNMNDLPSNMVDWVLVEARDENDVNTVLETRAAFLLKDGSIVDVDGTAGINFYNITAGELFFLAIRHRNHIDVVASNAVVLPNTMSYDFTDPANVQMGIAGSDSQLADLGGGEYGLYAGDSNGDGVITYQDFNYYLLEIAGVSTYSDADFNLSGGFDTNDFLLYFNNAPIIGLDLIRY